MKLLTVFKSPTIVTVSPFLKLTFVNFRRITDSIADAGSSNMTKLQLLMLQVCTVFVFYIEGEKEGMVRKHILSILYSMKIQRQSRTFNKLARSMQLIFFVRTNGEVSSVNILLDGTVCPG